MNGRAPGSIGGLQTNPVGVDGNVYGYVGPNGRIKKSKKSKKGNKRKKGKKGKKGKNGRKKRQKPLTSLPAALVKFIRCILK